MLRSNGIFEKIGQVRARVTIEFDGVWQIRAFAWIISADIEPDTRTRLERHSRRSTCPPLQE
jgi:hypothetical protein